MADLMAACPYCGGAMLTEAPHRHHVTEAITANKRSPAMPRQLRADVYRRRTLSGWRWRWRITDPQNGLIIGASSESYVRAVDCEANAQLLADADIVVVRRD